MNKAEALFRTFFEDDAEHVLFYLAHRVQIETRRLVGAVSGELDHWDELRVFDDDNELAVFDDKPNFIRVWDNIAVAAYVRKADRPSSMCPAGSRYECHRPVKNGPAQIATFNDGTIVEQYWMNGVRQLKGDLQLMGSDRHRMALSTSARDESRTPSRL